MAYTEEQQYFISLMKMHADDPNKYAPDWECFQCGGNDANDHFSDCPNSGQPVRPTEVGLPHDHIPPKETP